MPFIHLHVAMSAIGRVNRTRVLKDEIERR